MKKFEQVSSDGHRMSLAEVEGSRAGLGWGEVPMSHVWKGEWRQGREGLYSEVPFIMGPCPLNRMTD